MDLSARRPGPDVVRAIAMAGVVVMNYHGYLIIRGGDRGDGWAADLFDPWVGPLSTRFAATFVLTAGVGVTLMTERIRLAGTDSEVAALRWRLVRRGLVLYGAGLLVDFIWAGTILPYYGAMFVLASALFTLRSRWVVAIGAASGVAGWAIRWWRLDRTLAGDPPDWLTDPGPRSPVGLVYDVFVNGTHPLLPWLAFLCVGIVLGRVIGTSWWRPAAAGIGLVLYSMANLIGAIVTGERSVVVLSDDPFERGIVYTASALGTALLAFAAVSWLADRYASVPAVDALRRAGQLSLTLYLGHILVFDLLVDWLGVIPLRGLKTALLFAAAYWVAATTAAVAYQRRFGRGPAETVYRRLTN